MASVRSLIDRRRRRLAAVGGGLLVAVAWAASYSATSQSTSEAVVRSDPGFWGRVGMFGFYAAELGPGGEWWRWMPGGAFIAVRGDGRTWLAFRALSYERPRTLTLRDAAGTLQSVRVGTGPRGYLVGPLRHRDDEFLVATASPGPGREPPEDRRKLGVFMTHPVSADAPALVLPTGFWGEERSAREGTWRWMPRRARLDVVGKDRVRQAMVSFQASALRPRVRLTARWRGASTTTHRVPTSWKRYELGPVELRRGRAEIELSAAPAAFASSVDRRIVTVRMANVRVRAVAERPGARRQSR